jgi:hypothetical protein
MRKEPTWEVARETFAELSIIVHVSGKTECNEIECHIRPAESGRRSLMPLHLTPSSFVVRCHRGRRRC